MRRRTYEDHPLAGSRFVLSSLVAATVFSWGSLRGEDAERTARPSIQPALIEAIRGGDAAALDRYLGEHPGDLHARGEHGETPLSLAALYADATLVRILLERGASPNEADADGRTPLHWAVGDLEKTRLLLAHGSKPIARTRLGNSPLLLAARYPRSAAVVRLLIEKGAEADARNAFGINALTVAAAADDLETMRFLIDRGADVNAAPLPFPPFEGADPIFSGGLTPLAWAAFRGSSQAIELLIEKGAAVAGAGFLGSPLHQAAQRGNVEAARLLLDRGAPVDDRASPGGFSPLLWAADRETPDPRLVELLLSRGATPDDAAGSAIDSFMTDAHTALMIAERRGATPVVEALRRAGATERVDPWAKRVVSPPARELPEAISPKAIDRAIESALPWLEKTAIVSMRDFASGGSPCLSCHNHYYPLMALGLARQKGFARDEDAVRELSQAVVRDLVGLEDFFAEPTFHPAPSVSVGLALLGLELEGHGKQPVEDWIVHGLAAFQSEDGRWLNYLPRPPIQTSDVAATAFGARVLARSTLSGRKAELADRVDRARRWLATVEPYGIDERVFQLLGLHWAGEPKENLDRVIAALLAEQRDDGGWSQLPTLPSDAYATGHALYALYEVGGISKRDPAFERGVRYLLSTQLDDGTWFVRRRAFPFQPTYRTGFPHGRDGWISASGTSWAVIALLLAVDRDAVEPAATAEHLTSVDFERLPSRLPSAAARPVDFAKDIEPLFERSCMSCHQGEKARGGYRVEDVESILAGGRRREAAIIPGDSARSPLLYYVADVIADIEMPPASRRSKYPAWTPEEIGLVRAWIDQGAKGSETSSGN